jgi:hypothetical protein
MSLERRVRRGVLAVVAIAGALVGCTTLIGTKDIFLATDEAGGGSDATGGDADVGEGAVEGDGGARVDAPPDGTTADARSCGDTQSSSANCGSCGHDCLGGSCQAGVCQPIRIFASDAGAQPWAIAVDGTNVYFTDISGTKGNLYRMPKTGGGTTPMATTSDHLIYDLKIDTARAYFTSGSFGNGGAVEMVPLAGGAKQTIAQSAPGSSDPRGLTIDSQYVYWVNTDTPTNVQRATPVASSTVTTLAAAEVDPSAAQVDGTRLFWTSTSGGKIRHCTLPACTDRSDMVTGLTEPGVLATNSQRLFYNDGNTVVQIVKSAPIGPGALVAAGQSLPADIVADDRELYWINLGDYQKSFVDGDIRRCPVVTGAADCRSTSGGAGEIIARPGGLLARHLAIDATAVYWTVQMEGAVYRLAR